MAFRRATPAETLVVAVNAAPQPATVELDLPGEGHGSWVNLLETPCSAEAIADQLRITLPPQGGVILKRTG